MQYEAHERARLLVDRALIAEISPDEQRWLNGHTAECAECYRYGELSRRTLRALDSFAFEPDPAAAMRVQNAVLIRAAQLAARESRSRKVLVGTLVAIFLTMLGSIAIWRPATWLAVRWNLPSPAWQVGLALFWLLPSALPAMLPLLRGKLLSDESGEEGQTL